jgi:hypothetical protein
MHIRHFSIRTALALTLATSTLLHAATGAAAETISAAPAPSHVLHEGFPFQYDFAALSSLASGDGFYASLIPGSRVRLVVDVDQVLQGGFRRLTGSIEDAAGAAARGRFSITLDRSGQSLAGTASMDGRDYSLSGSMGHGHVEDMQLDNAALMHLE